MNFLEVLGENTAAALPGVGLNMISGLFNGSRVKAAEQRQFEYQKQLMQMQNEYQMSNWNQQFDKVNAYNDPSAQIARMKAAGINPNNAAANGMSGMSSATPNMGTVAPGSVGANAEQYDLGSNNAIGNGISQYLLGAQEGLMKSQRDYQDAMTEGQNMSNSVFLQNWNVEMAVKSSQVHLNESTINKLNYEFDVLMPQQEEMNEQTINNLVGAGIELNEKIALLKKDQKLTEEKINTEKAQQGVLGAQQGVLENEQNKIEQETIDLQYDNQVKSITASLAQKYNIDPSKLDAIEQINLALTDSGCSEEEINEFWNATRGTATNEFNRIFVKYVRGLGDGSTKIPRIHKTGRKISPKRLKRSTTTKLQNGSKSTTYTYE